MIDLLPTILDLAGLPQPEIAQGQSLAPLLIFDVWEDPYAFKSLHAERPDLVEKYLKMLDQIWKEHQALAKKFSRSGEVPMTQDQIETLRSLDYLR